MKKREMEKELDRLETARFTLDMKDFWNRQDWDLCEELNKKIRELKKALDK